MKISKTLFLSLLVCAVVVNLAGINLPFFTDDPGLYSSVSKQMLYHHDYLNLYTYGRDWLDKPHFPFWMAVLSFRIFGIAVWSYRLPAFLFFFGGVYYTYLFARKFYSVDLARLAVLIALLGQHVIMSNTDIRAEPYLFGLLIASIYHIANIKSKFTYTDLFAAAIFTACAVMTKGIFVIIGIYGALLGEMLFQRQFFTEVKKFKYWALLLLTILFLLPEVWALYTQFDLHPEKTVFGKQGFSGLKFFFWDSQFGRFFNSGPITRKSGDVFFFIHTLLWAFAPWCLLLYYAFIRKAGQIFKAQKLNEYYTFCGSLILLLLFSVSGFQLPFYTNILFPLFAILCAVVLTEELSVAARKYINITQGIYIVALVLLIVLLNFRISTNTTFHAAIVAVAATFLIRYFSKLNKAGSKLSISFAWSCATIILVNCYVIFYFYPQIISYKGEIKAAEFVNKNSAKTDSVFVFEDTNNIFQFYVNRPVRIIPLKQFTNAGGTDRSLYYVKQEDIDRLNASHTKYKLLNTFLNYDNENISPAFLNPQKRASTLVNIYIISH